MRFGYSPRLGNERPALFLTVQLARRGAKERRNVRAKIDTGANRSAAPTSLLWELDFFRPDRVSLPWVATVRGFFDGAARPVPGYPVDVSIPGAGLPTFKADVIERDRPYFSMGRDVLNRIVLLANGPAGFFEITGGTT